MRIEEAMANAVITWIDTEELFVRYLSVFPRYLTC